MNYYEVYDAFTGDLLARGNARECQKQLGCSSVTGFYALESRARRGLNKIYRVEVMKGGETDYPVLGKDDPLHKMEAERNARKG